MTAEEKNYKSDPRGADRKTRRGFPRIDRERTNSLNMRRVTKTFRAF